jgi:hypothetical protein
MRDRRIIPAIVFVILFLGVGGILVGQQNKEPAKEIKVVKTISQHELDRIIERRVAEVLLAEERSLHEEVLQAKHWHTAVFEGVKHTIYTGPGEVVLSEPFLKK